MSRTNMSAARIEDQIASSSWEPQRRVSRRHNAPPQRGVDIRLYPAQSGARANYEGYARLTKAHEYKASRTSRMLMYAFVALLMVLLFLQVGRIAQITAQSKRISELTSSIRETQNENENLTVRLSMQQNINRVRDEAIYRLGMIQPEDDQIRVVSLNGHSANAQMQAANGGESGGSE